MSLHEAIEELANAYEETAKKEHLHHAGRSTLQAVAIKLRQVLRENA